MLQDLGFQSFYLTFLFLKCSLLSQPSERTKLPLTHYRIERLASLRSPDAGLANERDGRRAAPPPLLRSRRGASQPPSTPIYRNRIVITTMPPALLCLLILLVAVPRPWSIAGEPPRPPGSKPRAFLLRACLQATVPPQRQPHRLAHHRPAATEHRHGVQHWQRALESNEMDMF